MPLQTTGQISLSQIQSEYGGSNPIGMSEYIKGGTNVPTTTGSAAGAWSSWFRTASAYQSYDSSFTSIGTDWITYEIGTYGNQRIHWAGTSLGPVLYNLTGTTITATDGYEYQKGTLGSTLAFGNKYFPATVRSYSIRRRTAATSVAANPNVPTSATNLGMSKYYGGTD